MMKHLLLALVLACGLCVCGCGAKADARTPQERWLMFPSGARSNHVTSLNARYLWMRGGGQIQQYDMVERHLTVFTDRDGLPLSTRGVERLIASDDDRCLLMLEHVPGPFLWVAGVGWQRLPSLNEKYMLKDVAFDSDGTILALATDSVDPAKQTTCTIFSLIDGHWRASRMASVPQVSAVVAFDNSYVVKAYDGRSKLFTFSKRRGELPVELPGTLVDENRLTYYRVAGRTYLGTPAPMVHEDIPRFPGVRIMQTLRELTPEGIVETPMEMPQFLDLQTCTFKPFALVVQPGQRLICEIDSADPWEIDGRRGATIFPIRDINGDVWLSDRTITGGTHRAPSGSMHEAHGLDATASDRVYFDAADGRWRRVIPADVWKHFEVVDAERKLAWAVTDLDASTMQLIDFRNGGLKIIQDMPREREWHLPFFRDHDGGWWLIGKTLIRLDENGTPSRMGDKSPSGLWFSEKTGDVFAYEHPDYLRFDRNWNQFEKVSVQEVHAAFAFQMGCWELSVLPKRWFNSMHSLMSKTPDGWQSVGQSTQFARRGDRILVTRPDGQGVWEYDGANHRWMQLHSGDFHVAFDFAGRRVLANHDTILLYDGDPFEDPNYRSQTALLQAQEQLLDQCVELLASSDERIRDYALQQIQSLSPLNKPKVKRWAEDEQFSEDVRALLRKAAANMPARLLPPSLFEAAHPPCPPLLPPQ